MTAAVSGSLASLDQMLKALDTSEYTILPGFCDVHVHFREPGFSYKETIGSGSKAAARGGYTAVCPMPNLKPVPDSAKHMEEELKLIREEAVIDVLPYASITVNEDGRELSDMEALAESAIAFSDDGRGVQDEEMMRDAMTRAKALGKMIVAHCEVNDLLHGGYIHDGVYAAAHGHKGICSESEWKEIERDVRLAEETGCAYHVCHISTKESVEIIRDAKRRGVDVTCETAPHFLMLDENDLQEDGRFKMNPPLRAKEDREALIAGLIDGTIDCIATDHAPHSAEEKSRGLKGSAMGVVGLETAFPVLYTGLVKTGVITMERLIEAMYTVPRKRFGIPAGSCDFAVWDLAKEYVIDPAEFLSKGKSTPFEGWKVFGRCMLTVHNGEIVYLDPSVTVG
ncbi:MAG: dihydroorotase [Lachnospiraceae bacterium]|nr:dihydroorotase [Lachnospiraceae bacterium]